MAAAIFKTERQVALCLSIAKLCQKDWSGRSILAYNLLWEQA